MKNKTFLWIILIVLALAIMICCAVKIFTVVKAASAPSAEYQSDYTYEIPAESDGTTWVVRDGEITPVQSEEELQKIITNSLTDNAN